MDDWLAAALHATARAEPAVLVCVAATRGSSPRGPGARMLVGAQGRLAGSIGGGRLEQLAIDTVRADLARGQPPHRHARRYPLGASAGQCCGGVVHLVFDPLDASRQAELIALRDAATAGRAWVRVLPLDGGPATVLDAATAAPALPLPVLAAAARLLSDSGGDDDDACLIGHGPAPLGADGRAPGAWLVERARPPALHLALFGAGHVGRALVRALAPLPLRVSWVDTRADEFPATCPANVRMLLTDDPLADVADMPTGSHWVVASPSHALDLELVRAILSRHDALRPATLVGLVGSACKRARFAAQLAARGMDPARIARLQCPVGLPGLVGKEPAVIALAIAAQLMSLRDARSFATIGAAPLAPAPLPAQEHRR